jgi:23S rRNA pseudouridine1911/1915/1917 synthase
MGRSYFLLHPYYSTIGPCTITTGAHETHQKKASLFVCTARPYNEKTPKDSQMTQQYTFTAEGGERLDRLVVAHLGDALSRAQVQALVREGRITIDGQPAKPGWKLKGGETITVEVPPPAEAPLTLEAEPIPLQVVYEDSALAVIDKPAGLIVHPGVHNEPGTLAHAILARYPEIGAMHYAPQRRGIVHRLDKETSGLILIARTEAAMRALMTQFSERTVEKTYTTLVEKPPKTPTGRISAPIERDPVQRKRMTTSRDGKPAITEFSVTERFPSGQTLLSVKLLTGRTHQIRVHMAFIGSPVVGDALYGYRRQRLPLRGQFLHAARLCFDHPTTDERLCFESPLPARLERILDMLRRMPKTDGRA